MLLELIQIIEKFGKPPDLFLPFNKLDMDVILDFWKSCKDSAKHSKYPPLGFLSANILPDQGHLSEVRVG